MAVAMTTPIIETDLRVKAKLRIIVDDDTGHWKLVFAGAVNGLPVILHRTLEADDELMPLIERAIHNDADATRELCAVALASCQTTT